MTFLASQKNRIFALIVFKCNIIFIALVPASEIIQSGVYANGLLIKLNNKWRYQRPIMTIQPIYTPPPVAEMQRRKEAILARMEIDNLDYFVCLDTDNVFWLSNFANYAHERPFILVLHKSGRLSFVVPKLETPHVRKRVIGEIELITYFEFPAPEGETWKDRFQGVFEGSSRVGVESGCPWFVHAAIPGEVHASEAVEEARYIKSDYELGRIIYASNNATDKMLRLLKMAKPGWSAISILSTLDKMTKVQLLLDEPELNFFATKTAFTVQPPSLSDDPHNFTEVARLGVAEGGPNVALINGTYNGYGTEVERTFFVNTVPEAAKKPYKVMMEARQKAFDLCKPGVSMHELDKSCNEIFRRAGYGENMLHRTGHSIGVTGHEGPFLAEGFHHEIKPGMIFTIEPGIYLPGVGGFRHSDTVMVTDQGNQSLTPVPESLEDMTLTGRRSLLKGLMPEEKTLLKIFARLKGLEILNPAN